MSLWSAIAEKIKEILRKMIGSRTIEQTLHVAPLISSQMEEAITKWGNMYKGEAPWLHEPSWNDPTRVVSLGLPSLIASEKARTALIEWASEITAPTEDVEIDNPNYKEPEPDIFGNLIPSTEPKTIKESRPIGDTSRAEYLNKQYEKLKKAIRIQLEYGIAKGGLVIKPYPVINKQEGAEYTADIEFDFIQADAFYPLAFDASGKITEAAFIQTKTEKDTVYRRLEYHKWNGNQVQIVNKAFKATTNMNNTDLSGLDLGHEVPLKDVYEWKDLQETTTIKDVHQPLFAYFRTPEANTIDTASPLGVSGYSRAVSLIQDADEQYSRLLWEYEGGELAIDIDRDALRVDIDTKGNDHTVLTKHQQRLYRKVDLSQTGDTYYPYAPSLRDVSYRDGLNTILMRIEDACSLSRGTLSDASAEARTATELKILKQRTYQANHGIQTSLENTLKEVVYIMDVYCDLYNITPKGDYDVSCEWDDSLLTDMDLELSKRIQLRQQGVYGRVELRMWYFGETEQQAVEALAKIDGENQQSMEQDLMMQANQMQLQSQQQEELNA